jgi:hypothetical protein
LNVKNKTSREVLENASNALSIISYEIKKADSIYTPVSTAGQLSLKTYEAPF